MVWIVRLDCRARGFNTVDTLLPAVAELPIVVERLQEGAALIAHRTDQLLGVGLARGVKRDVADTAVNGDTADRALQPPGRLHDAGIDRTIGHDVVDAARKLRVLAVGDVLDLQRQATAEGERERHTAGVARAARGSPATAP